MSKIIKVNTSNVEGWKSILSGILSNTEYLGNDVSSLIQTSINQSMRDELLKLYHKVYENRDNILRVNAYFTSIIDHIHYVENLLAAIDPLNYDDTINEAENSVNKLRANLLTTYDTLDELNSFGGDMLEILVDNNERIEKGLEIASFSEDALKKMNKIGKAGKIAGFALNVANNLTENNHNLGRASAEIITETAIDIGMDALLTFGASALLGATLPASLAVGAVAWGVGALADWGFKTLNEGKGITETVSDWLLDKTVADWFGWK